MRSNTTTSTRIGSRLTGWRWSCPEVADEDSFLRRTPFYEATDSLYSYFVKFRDYRLNSTVAPYEYVKNDIELILLNNRRVNYIQSLENDIYEDAVSKNNYIIY